MRRTISTFGLNCLAFAAVVAGKTAVALRLRRMPDGWRRIVGASLRSEASKFTLATFGLDLFSDRPALLGGVCASVAAEHLAGRLEAFFRHQTDHHISVEHRRSMSLPVSCGPPVVRLLRDDEAVDESFAGCVLRMLPPVDEATDPTGRFVAPDFVANRHGGSGVYNILARPSRDFRSVDLWVQVHHAASDGMPVQEMLVELRAEWGTVEATRFPPPGRMQPHGKPRRCHAEGERSIEFVQDFVDFRPLLALRKRLASKFGIELSVGALLIWRLGLEPEFRGIRFSLTVDSPATKLHPRAVNFAPAPLPDPRLSINGVAGLALATYATAFNELIGQTKLRLSKIWRATDAIGLLPARLVLPILRANHARTCRTFGTMGLTILREAEVFVVPMSDVGADDGFVAIGQMDLPDWDGGRVGSVTIKGPPGRLDAYLPALRRAMAACAEV